MDNLTTCSIDAKKLRSFFWGVQLINISLATTTYVIIRNEVWLFPGIHISKSFTSTLFTVLIGLGFVYSLWHKKKLDAVINLEDPVRKASAFEQLCKYRFMWFLLLGMLSCALGILTGRMLFFYFGIIEVALLLPFYPALKTFKMELRNENVTINS